MAETQQPGEGRATTLRDELRRAGVRTVIGTTVNAAGLILAKAVPTARLEVFGTVGLGAAPVWHVFCVDGGIAFTDTITAVGDNRLRLDLEGVRVLGGAVAWGPADHVRQDGTPDPACTRSALSRIESRLADAGLQAAVGHELEFVLVARDGTALPHAGWTPYGASGLLDREEFVADVFAAAATAGIQLEQLHCEYGPDQYEFSLPPLPPVTAADAAVLARIIVGRVARSHEVRASFSPVPFADGVGNGAHQHVSLTGQSGPLFAGGDGAHGITTDGGAAIGGLVRGLPTVQGILSGSVLSGPRLAPGLWSGVHTCWGLENREAAVRFIREGPASVHGANVEVKIIDPSANVYTASAAILALALQGIATGAALPAEVPDDPSRLSAEQRDASGITVLPNDIETVLDGLDSGPARSLLGDDIVDTTLAVRRHEQQNYAGRPVAEIAELFRLAWTV